MHKAVKKAASASMRIWYGIFERAANYAGLDTLDAPAGWSKPGQEYLDNFTNKGADVTVALSDAALDAKRAAMRAHASQIWLADGSTTRTNPEAAVAALHEPEHVPGAYGLSNLLVMPLLRAEYFQLGQGEPADDLLGGL